MPAPAAGQRDGALQAAGDGLELALRQAPQEGLGLVLPAQPQQALLATRAFAGDVPLTVYVRQPSLRNIKSWPPAWKA